jgi:hypothetical protein
MTKYTIKTAIAKAMERKGYFRGVRRGFKRVEGINSGGLKGSACEEQGEEIRR